MASREYEKVTGKDADNLSDASGSDISGEQDASRTTLSRRRVRTSEEIQRHDRETLEAEDEAERLLGGNDSDARGLNSIFRGTAYKPRPKDNRRRKHDTEKAREETIHDVEQGDQDVEDSDDPSEVEIDKLDAKHSNRSWRMLRWTRFICLHILVLIAFVLLLFGAFKASRPPLRPQLAKKLSNGTHTFYPTTIVISLDGFRADFLQRGLTPTLNAFIKDGVSPKYMLPSFPSVTFANHFTLATGHYPESHGIVGNTFWDPHTQKEFYYTDPARSLQPEWWNAEPFWVTAENVGVRSAIHMWPGSEAHLGPIEPAFVDEFNGAEQLDHKVDRILGWLDLAGPEDNGYNPNEPRPQLIAAYVPDVDTDGHNYGPNSTEIQSTIQRADNMLADIFRGIDARNLTKIVNIIIVSDHGMATTDATRLIQFEDLLDPALIEHTDGWPLYGLRPYDTSDDMLHRLYDQLLNKSREEKYQHSFDVYLRDENMPARYHFSHNDRIAPLWIVPKAGWAIVTEEEFNVASGLKNGDVYHPRGLHGYDFEHPLMRAIFVARGPAFPHPKGSQIDPFQNIEVYNILCDSLGIEPAANNGTIRLPFSTKGLHDDSKSQEIPADPPSAPMSNIIPAIIPVPIPTDMPPFELGELGELGPSPTVQASVVWTTDSHGSLVTMLVDPQGHPLRPWIPEETHDWQDDNLNNHKTWWGWFENEYHDFKDWAGGIFHKPPPDNEGWVVEGLNDTKHEVI